MSVEIESHIVPVEDVIGFLAVRLQRWELGRWT